MYVILVYDIASPKRGTKLLKRLRQSMIWVQNSVFEGHLSEAGLEKILIMIKALIKPEEDSIIYYTFDSMNYTERRVLGLERNSVDSFI